MQAPKTGGPIFVDADGQALAIFVAPHDIPDVPKLTRSLRNHGARLIHDLQQCDIILVNPGSESGNQFINDWKDTKVVLNYKWAGKCIAAGRVLGADNSAGPWGGWVAVVTEPVEGTALSDADISANDLLSDVSPKFRKKSQSSPLSEQPVQFSSMSGGSSFSPPVPSTMPTNFQLSQIPFPSQSYIPQQLMQQNIPQMTMLQNMPQMAMQQNMSQMAMQNMPQIPQAINNTPLMQQVQMNSELFQMAFLDVFQLYMQSQWQSASLSAHTQDNNSTMQSPQAQVQNGSTLAPRTSMETILPSPTSQRNSPPTASPSATLPTSLKRRRKESLSESESVFKGKGKAANTSNMELFTSRGKSLSFYVQVEIKNRKDILSAIRKNGGTLCTSMASADYAVLKSHTDAFKGLFSDAEDSDVCAVTSEFVFDCVKEQTFLDPNDYTFHKTLKTFKFKPSSHTEKKRDTVERSTLAVRGKPKSKTEVRPESEDKSKVESKKDDTPVKPISTDLEKMPATNVVLREEKQPEKIQKIVDQVPMKKDKPISKQSSTKGKSIEAVDDPVLRARFPSPPPPDSCCVPMGTGKYIYSSEESEYLKRYVAILLQRDLSVSNTAIGNRLHEKMSHHTAASWVSHITTKEAKAIEELRKRAGIESRKRKRQAGNIGELSSYGTAEHTEQKASALPAPAAVSSLSTRPLLKKPRLPSPPKQISELEQDLNAIVKFFVDGYAEDEAVSDEAVMEILASKERCRSESSWNVFYNKQHKEVMKRYRAVVEP